MKRRLGLTLVELLVTLTIMALLTVVGMAGYGSSQKKHEVKNAAIELKDVIEKTKRYSLGPRKLDDTIWGYCFQVKKDSTKWWIKEYYSPNTNKTYAPNTDALWGCSYNDQDKETVVKDQNTGDVIYGFRIIESGTLSSRLKKLVSTGDPVPTPPNPPLEYADIFDGFPTYKYEDSGSGAGELASKLPSYPYEITLEHQNSSDKNHLKLYKNGTVEWMGS